MGFARWTVGVLALSAGTVAGCSSEAPDLDALPSCGEWTTRAITEQDLEDGCWSWGERNERDEPTRVRIMPDHRQCEDGRILLWTDGAWGYVGEPWDASNISGAEVPPPHAARSCRPD